MVLGGLLFSTVPCGANPAIKRVDAPAPQTALGVSNLVLHLDGDDEIGLAGSDLRVLLLERLRERGIHAVGAENLVFGKDEANRATHRLGGTIRQIRCLKQSGVIRCWLGIEWLILDVARDTVVYKAMVRRMEEIGIPGAKKLPSMLIQGSLDALVAKESFKVALAPSKAVEPPPSTYKETTFSRCSPQGKRMPKAAEGVLSATALVRSGGGHGSGVFLTADGLLLTAAHVVDGPSVKVKLRDGVEVDASVVRRSESADVALLKVGLSMSGQACLDIKLTLPSLGDELYAVGVPLDEKLAFSLTKGILSGVREINGQRKLQTDAAINPGNSGGPLVDKDGAAVAIITSKLTGKTVEGVAFSVPMKDALAALALVPGTSTSPELHSSKVSVEPVSSSRQEPLVEPEDPVPDLDLDSKKMAAEAERAAAERLRIATEQRALAQQIGEANAINLWDRSERARVRSPELEVIRNLSITGLLLGGVFIGVGFGMPASEDSSLPTAMKLLGLAGVGGGGAGLLAYSSRRTKPEPWPGHLVPAGSPPEKPAPTQNTSPNVSFMIGPRGLGVAGSF